jgi:hypothetical protein
MNELGRALGDLLDAPLHPDPVRAVSERIRRRRVQRLGVCTAVVVAALGGVGVSLLGHHGSRTAQLGVDPTPSASGDLLQENHACLVAKGWKADGPSGFFLGGPSSSPLVHRELEADRVECYRSEGAHYDAQAAPTGVPYDASTAPLWFRDRAALDDCGDLVVSASGEVPQSAKDCLRAAGNGAGAELGVSRNTDEGDPIVTYYRNGIAGHVVEILTDSTRDSFGVKAWSAVVCTSLDVDTLMGTGCRPG